MECVFLYGYNFTSRYIDKNMTNLVLFYAVYKIYMQ